MAKKIICSSCGAKIDSMAPKCPYCDNINLPGAEAAYMKKLEDVKEDLEELAAVPEQETKEAFRSKKKWIAIGVLVFALIIGGIVGITAWFNYAEEQQTRKQILWLQNHEEQWDEWYEAGEMELLLQEYNKAQDQGDPVWMWSHYKVMIALWYERDLLGYLWEVEETKGTLTKDQMIDMLYFEMKVYYDTLEESGNFKEDREAIAKYTQRTIQDFQERWGLDQAFVIELAQKHYGVISVEECKKYIEEHY